MEFDSIIVPVVVAPMEPAIEKVEVYTKVPIVVASPNYPYDDITIKHKMTSKTEYRIKSANPSCFKTKYKEKSRIKQ